MNSRPDKPLWSDVQGLVTSGYGQLRHSLLLVFRINPGYEASARKQLHALLDRVTTGQREDGRTVNAARLDGDDPRAKQALNMAFTYHGLCLLRPDAGEATGFCRPFTDGMVGNDHRSRVLGDVDDNAPEHWRWGGDPANPVDGALFLFAVTPAVLGELRAEVVKALEGVVTLAADIRTALLRDGRNHQREPFGFADGLSQPLLEGTRAARQQPDSPHVIKLGEVLLGYEDNAGIESIVPRLGGCATFGLNGTYVALRQLEQHVARFHECVATAAAAHGMEPAEVAAKMMGRTYDGDVLTPVGPRSIAGNDFGYAGDPDGLGCPLGAHIRRGTPRDMIGETAADGWRITNRHRILRRGRPYRERFAANGKPAANTCAACPFDGETGHGVLCDVRSNVEGSERRVRCEARENGERVINGLVFVALNADLERQFEFIHGNWMHDDGFAELAGERDPIIGVRTPGGDSYGVPRRPVRRRLTGLPAFVTTRGGAYFFMPGLNGLAQLLGA